MAAAPPRLYGLYCALQECGLIEINSRPDHVHLYVSLPSTITIADLVNAFKANSSHWIRQTFSNRRLFWMAGKDMRRSA